MFLPFEFISTFAGILVAAVVTVFIFAVTLLGRAIEYAKEDETKIQAERTSGFQEKISDLQNRLNEAKLKGDSKDLEDELGKLTKDRELHEQKLSSIKKKYSYIGFHEAVIHPNLVFILSMLLAQIGADLVRFIVNTPLEVYLVPLFIVAFSLLSYGIYRFCKTLILIQGIASRPIKENFGKEDVINIIERIFIKREEEIQKKNEEKLVIKFVNITFPLQCKIDQEMELSFRVSLVQGKIIRDVNVWFFIPDEITLLQPSEEVSWRQGSDYDLPNIKTVKVSIGDVSKGIFISGKLKMKMPSLPTTFQIFYRVYGEGYRDERIGQEVNIT